MVKIAGTSVLAMTMDSVHPLMEHVYVALDIKDPLVTRLVLLALLVKTVHTLANVSFYYYYLFRGTPLL